MTFRDLKLPNGLAKKKKLQLYKSWILEPLEKGAPIRSLSINPDRDRYALTETQAVEAALNELGWDRVAELMANELSFSLDDASKLPTLRNYFVVILTVTLENGVMDDDVIIPPNPDYAMDLDPHFAPELGLLTVTVKDRYSDLQIQNYTIHDIGLHFEESTQHITVQHLKLDEVVINHAVAGGK